MPTATATKPVTFIAFASDLLLIKEPQRPIYQTDGAGNSKGAGVTPGEHVQFENRKFTTDDPELIEWMRSHEYFNKHRGFREDFDSQRPTQDERMVEIATLAAEGNIDGLRALIRDEESYGDHGRGTVLGPARKAHERLEVALEQIERAATDAPEDGSVEEPSAEAGADSDPDADGADSSDSG